MYGFTEAEGRVTCDFCPWRDEVDEVFGDKCAMAVVDELDEIRRELHDRVPGYAGAKPLDEIPVAILTEAVGIEDDEGRMGIPKWELEGGFDVAAHTFTLRATACAMQYLQQVQADTDALAIPMYSAKEVDRAFDLS